MLFYIFVTCMVMAGAILIFGTEGAVNIADSAFTANQAQLSGGRMIFLDNDNNNNNNDYDNDIHIYPHVYTL